MDHDWDGSIYPRVERLGLLRRDVDRRHGDRVMVRKCNNKIMILCVHHVANAVDYTLSIRKVRAYIPNYYLYMNTEIS